MLIDFGLVKQKVTQTWAFKPSNSSSSDQSFVGKFGYMPLEQIRMGQCYPCSDLYALGVTAIVLLTGIEPNFLIDRQTLEWQWHFHVKLSDHLGRILDKMLVEKPKDRYQSAQVVLAELQLHPSPVAMIAVPIPPTELDTEVTRTGKEHQVPEIAEELPQSQRRVEELRGDATNPDQPTPEFINRCQQELARHLGPMAKYILEETLEQHPDISPAQLVEAIAAKVLNTQQAMIFAKV